MFGISSSQSPSICPRVLFHLTTVLIYTSHLAIAIALIDTITPTTKKSKLSKKGNNFPLRELDLLLLYFHTLYLYKFLRSIQHSI